MIGVIGTTTPNSHNKLYNEKIDAFITSFQFIIAAYGFITISDTRAMYQTSFSFIRYYRSGLHKCYSYIGWINWRAGLLPR